MPHDPFQYGPWLSMWKKSLHNKRVFIIFSIWSWSFFGISFSSSISSLHLCEAGSAVSWDFSFCQNQPMREEYQGWLTNHRFGEGWQNTSKCLRKYGCHELPRPLATSYGHKMQACPYRSSWPSENCIIVFLVATPGHFYLDSYDDVIKQFYVGNVLGTEKSEILIWF